MCDKRVPDLVWNAKNILQVDCIFNPYLYEVSTSFSQEQLENS